jgi:23S rRNA-/tRNA-specific pseudouridylate synthase
VQEKAYKLLALQEGITNRSAKDLIDRGVVYSGGKRVVMARALMDARSRFRVESIGRVKVIYEDKFIIAIDKPPFITSEQIAKKQKAKLLHRLDKETSGVLLLTKDEEFRERAVGEFKQKRVKKEYIAWVEGRVAESFVINKPIKTVKRGNRSFSKISKDGKEAISLVEPLMIEGKFSKIKVVIETGRTHQIRVHLKSEGYPIVGDREYGGREHKRVLLHSHKIELFDYSFISKEPKEFSV